MNRRILIAVVVMLATGSLTFLAIRSKPRRVTLPDGKIVEFLSTTVGTEPFSSEEPWHKLARAVLPKSLQKWLPRKIVIPCSTSTNIITVYVRVTDPAGAPIVGKVWDRVQAEDSDGFKYNPDGAYCSFGVTPSSQHVGLPLRALPRRQKEYRLHFLEPGGDVLGTLTVPNPISGPFEVWKPGPMPQTATNGLVEVSLKGMRLTGTRRWPSVTPDWKVTGGPPHWRRAFPGFPSLQDSSGNEALWLSTNEPAWRIRLALRRYFENDFQPHERWMINDIPVPKSGHVPVVNLTTNILGVTATVHLVSAAGDSSVTNGAGSAVTTVKPGLGFSIQKNGTNTVASWTSDKPFVVVEIQNREKTDEVLVNIFDETGLKLNSKKSTALAPRYDGGPSTHRIELDLWPESKSLAVEVILNRPLFFDFLVNPKDLQITEDSSTP